MSELTKVSPSERALAHDMKTKRTTNYGRVDFVDNMSDLNIPPAPRPTPFNLSPSSRVEAHKPLDEKLYPLPDHERSDEGVELMEDFEKAFAKRKRIEKEVDEDIARWAKEKLELEKSNIKRKSFAKRITEYVGKFHNPEKPRIIKIESKGICAGPTEGRDRYISDPVKSKTSYKLQTASERNIKIITEHNDRSEVGECSKDLNYLPAGDTLERGVYFHVSLGKGRNIDELREAARKEQAEELKSCTDPKPEYDALVEKCERRQADAEKANLEKEHAHGIDIGNSVKKYDEQQVKESGDIYGATLARLKQVDEALVKSKDLQEIEDAFHRSQKIDAESWLVDKKIHDDDHQALECGGLEFPIPEYPEPNKIVDSGDLLEFLQNECDIMMKIAKKKNHDYAGTKGDPLRNFKMIEILGGATTDQGFLTRMTDKFMRIINFSTSGKLLVEDESIKDTLRDFANYLLLYSAYLEQKKHDK